MPVPGGLSSLSTVAASNFPDGSTELPSVLDNYQRTHWALFKRYVSGSPASISATLTLAWPDDYGYVEIAGSGEILDIADTFTWPGWRGVARFAGATTLSHSSNFALPGEAQIVTAAGDMAFFVRTLAGNYECVSYERRGTTNPEAGVFTTLDAHGAASFSASVLVGGALDVKGPASFSASLVAGGRLDVRGAASFSASVDFGGAVSFRGGSSFSATLTAAKFVAVGEVVAASFSGVAVATQAQMEAASTTGALVTPGRQHFHPSAAKFFLTADSAGSINVSYNVTSITDNGTGDLGVTIGTDFSSVNWASAQGVYESGATAMASKLQAKAAGTCTFITYNSTNGAATDPTHFDLAGFGDQ